MVVMHTGSRTMKTITPKCYVHSSLDSYSALTELMAVDTEAIDLNMTPIHSCAVN